MNAYVSEDAYRESVLDGVLKPIQQALSEGMELKDVDECLVFALKVVADALRERLAANRRC
jgi:hypothetical protein